MSFSVGDVCEFTESALKESWGQWTITSISNDGVYADAVDRRGRLSKNLLMSYVTDANSRLNGFQVVTPAGPTIIEDWRL